MKKLGIYAILMILGTYSAQAGDPIDWNRFMHQGAAMQLKTHSISVTQLNASGAQSVSGPNSKSVARAGLFSAVLPGAGQVYAGSYIKAAAFITVEAVSWFSFFHFKNEGQKIEDEFENFADTNWDEPTYWEWVYDLAVKEGENVTQGDLASLRAFERKRFSHSLHLNKDQQYYEMIGKYDQFNAGWDDSNYDPTNPDEYFKNKDPFLLRNAKLRTPNRLFYETRRNASNENFRKSSTGATIALLNHLLSAADAALTVHFQNRKLNMAVRMTPAKFCADNPPMMTLHMNW